MVCVRLNPVKGIGEVSSVRMSEHDAIALTRSLLRFETVNPPAASATARGTPARSSSNGAFASSTTSMPRREPA